jgi:hypothetical protein
LRVPEPPEPDRSQVGPPERPRAGELTARVAEEGDALPVLADGPTVLRPRPLSGVLASTRRAPGAGIPAVQVVVAAAGGFVAGAAVVGLVNRRQRNSAALAQGRRAGRVLSRGGPGSRGPGRADERLSIVGSRSLLVDVHLLGGSRAGR